MDVGFVGLGQMGAGMARRLLEQGHRVTVWNRDRAKCAPLREAGAMVAASPREAAEPGIVVSMLADDRAAEAVIFGQDGILTAGSGITHVSSSTLGVTLVDRLAEAHRGVGQRLLGSPVLGRPDVAAAGQLSLILGGGDLEIAECRPLLDALGARAIRMGPEPAMAAAAKLALNASLAVIAGMIGEAYAIAGGSGVAASAMLELFNETGFGNRIIAGYGALLAEQRFEPAGFPVRLGRKDVGLAIDAAGEGAPLPIAHMLRDRLDAMIARGEGELDWAALGKIR